MGAGKPTTLRHAPWRHQPETYQQAPQLTEGLPPKSAASGGSTRAKRGGRGPANQQPCAMPHGDTNKRPTSKRRSSQKVFPRKAQHPGEVPEQSEGEGGRQTNNLAPCPMATPTRDLAGRAAASNGSSPGKRSVRGEWPSTARSRGVGEPPVLRHAPRRQQQEI